MKFKKQFRKVKYKELIFITDKACKVICYNGQQAVLPLSQIYYNEKEVFVPLWLANKVQLQYSNDTYFVYKNKIVQIYYHKPDKITLTNIQINKELLRDD